MRLTLFLLFFFFFNDTATTEIYTLSLHDALPIFSRTVGPVLGPFECYLTMRGIKPFPLRMERHCANACRVASWLAAHPGVERVYFPGDPRHPDADAIRRLFPPGLYGGMVSFELKSAGQEEV